MEIIEVVFRVTDNETLKSSIRSPISTTRCWAFEVLQYYRSTDASIGAGSYIYILLLHDGTKSPKVKSRNDLVLEIIRYQNIGYSVGRRDG